MRKNLVIPVNIIKYKNNNELVSDDILAIEEPLEIRLNFFEAHRKEKSIAVTMRTPGDDELLAIGFLFTEGVLQDFSQVLKIQYCKNVKPDELGNVIIVYLKDDFMPNLSKLNRNFYTTSSCGVCGKSSIADVYQNCSIQQDNFLIETSTLPGILQAITQHQLLFNHTGGVHASALFNKQGELIKIFEDVGRHNSLDKMIGYCLQKGIQANKHLVLLSGRIGFELVQKAAMFGFPFLVAVGAPSSLACSLAKKCNMTLVGFLKSSSFNVYHGHHRLT